MMQQSCNGNMVGPCSCGYYHHHHHSQPPAALSMLFRPYDQYEDQTTSYDGQYQQQMYNGHHTYPSSPPSSSAVDCTLSLGTPSTRLTTNDAAAEKPRRSSYFCWDILQSKQSTSHQRSSRGSYSTTTSSGGGGGDGPTNGRRCANCDTTSTPLWRNGPKGPKSLCNACGIRFKKEEKRASAAAATNGNAAGHGGGMEALPHQYMSNGSSWVQHHNSPAAQRIPYFSSAAAYGGGHEFRFMEDVDDHRDSDAGLPYLSWRLNVTDRPGLVHDFTR